MAIARLMAKDCPKTKAEFIDKWNRDHVFRARAKATGINVVFDTVVFPDGKVAGKRVK